MFKKDNKVAVVNNNNKDIPVQILAFTFFYAICIYLLMIGFVYWSWQKND